MRLVSRFCIDLGQLARGDVRLSAAVKPVLSVRSAYVMFSLMRLTGGSDPSVPIAVARAQSPERLVSKLPDGFSALELHAQCLRLICPAAVPVSSPETAAHMLCLFLANAPASYRRFSLCCTHYLPLRIQLSWPMGIPKPDGTTGWHHDAELELDGMQALAGLLQGCVVMHNMSAAFVSEPTNHIDVFRL